MSWQDASIAVTGTVMVIVLGAVLIWQIFRTAQVVIVERGLPPLKVRQMHVIEESANAQPEALSKQGESEPTKNGEDS